MTVSVLSFPAHLFDGKEGGNRIQAVHNFHVLNKFRPFLTFSGEMAALDLVQNGFQLGAGSDGAFEHTVHVEPGHLGDILRVFQDLVAHRPLIQDILLLSHGDGHFGKPLDLKGIIGVDHPFRRQVDRLVENAFGGDVTQPLAVVFQRQGEGQTAPVLNGAY